jgi:hypothetical protein
MDKLHVKKQVASKKKKRSSENKTGTVKKMRGGNDKKFDLTNKDELQEFKEFVEKKFILSNNSQNQNYSSNYSDVKKSMIAIIESHIQRNNTKKNFSNSYLFYVFQTKTNEIICVGAINNMVVDYFGKNYIHIPDILSRKKGERGGISALYHLLLLVQDTKYYGICLTSTTSSNSFYKHLGFVEMNKRYTVVDTLFFDKENLPKIEAKLPHPITTEFYSTYPI